MKDTYLLKSCFHVSVRVCVCVSAQNILLPGNLVGLSPCVRMRMRIRMRKHDFRFMERTCAQNLSFADTCRSTSTEPAHTLFWSVGNNDENCCRLVPIHEGIVVCSVSLLTCFEGRGAPATCAVFFSSWLLQQLQQPVRIHLPFPLLPVAIAWKTPVPSYFGYTL